MAVREVISAIVEVVDAVHERCAKGGGIFYVGPGTRGRIGVLDASECSPTHGIDPEMVQGIVAGGKEAFFLSAEGIEDHESLGVQAIAEHQIGAFDSVIGIAASGTAPLLLLPR